jgi:hypothetical protein
VAVGLDVVERNWELMSLSIVGRYHFTSESRSWDPYIALGIGAQEHHDGTQRQPSAFGFNQSRTGTDVMFLIGARIDKLFGKNGINVLTRLFGILLAALAVQIVLDGLGGYGLHPVE